MGINGAGLATCLGSAVCSILFVLTFSYDTGIKIRRIVLLTNKDIKLVSGIIKKQQK